MNQNLLTEKSTIMDVHFEQKLLASQLVSEVRRGFGHISLTFTDNGLNAFTQALITALKEEIVAANNSRENSRGKLLTKKDVMSSLGVSHTTLWKWQKKGYLMPVKIGKRVFYREEEITKLTD